MGGTLKNPALFFAKSAKTIVDPLPSGSQTAPLMEFSMSIRLSFDDADLPTSKGIVDSCHTPVFI
jgi:hypothetical protein